MTDHPEIPARDHACWSDPVWRSSTLSLLTGRHNLDAYKLAQMTGVSRHTARFWMGSHEDVIPANTLRALLFDLRAS